MIYYIYTLSDPDTKEVRYIGQTFQPKVRLAQHCGSQLSGKSRRAEWIRGLVSEGKKPVMSIIEEVEGDYEYSMAYEERWILHYRSIGADLTNVRPLVEHQPKPKKTTMQIEVDVRQELIALSEKLSLQRGIAISISMVLREGLALLKEKTEREAKKAAKEAQS